MADDFIVEHEGRIARLYINRGHRKNAVTQNMWVQVPEIFRDLAEDDRVKVLIIASKVTGIFCAGADITEFEALMNDKARRSANMEAMRQALDAIASFEKPVIAQINGDCMGAGCALALACDLRFASHNARFSIPPAKLGLVYPLTDLHRLVMRIGLDQAKALLFTAERFDAVKAHEIGLINNVVEAAQLSAYVDDFVQSIDLHSQHSVRVMKYMLGLIEKGLTSETEETRQLFLDCYDGMDHKEGVRAFLEKRPAKFQ